MSTNPIWLCAAKLGVPEDRPRSRGQKRRLISAAAPRMMHVWIVLLALALAALVVAAPGGGGDSGRSHAPLHGVGAKALAAGPDTTQLAATYDDPSCVPGGRHPCPQA